MTQVLLEREDELSAIEAALARARAGQGGVLLLEGAAGAGKTALLGEARRRAEPAGMRILGGRGAELERDFPFGVARQLFEAPLRAATTDQRTEWLSGPAGLCAPAVDPLAPAAAAGARPADQPYAVVHGLYWLTANLAEHGPLVVVVDDAHWADEASLRFLAYLANRVEEIAVGVFLAVRTGEAERRAELRQIASCARALVPPPLSVEAVAVLASEHLGKPVSEDFAAACEQVTGGNPYLLGELLAALADAGVVPTSQAAQRVRTFAPRTVARAVLGRLAALSPAAERLARAVALLGRDAELRHAARIAALDDATAARAADDLAAASILLPVRPLEFVHPLVRSAIYAELPEGARALDHRRAAELLAGEGAEPERVATHLLATEPAGDASVVAHLRRAAARVSAHGALEGAVRYLTRARAEPPPPGERSAVLLELGGAEASLGAAHAPETLRLAVESAQEARGRAAAARALARALHMRGDSLGAARVLEDAVDQLDEANADVRARLEADLLLLTQAALAARRGLMGRLAVARAGAARLSGVTAPIVQAVVAVDLAHTDGTALDAIEMTRRALGGAKVMQEQGDVSVAFYLAITALGLCDQLAGAGELLDVGLSDAQRRGSLEDFQSTLCVRAWVRLRQGRLRDAEADVRMALERARGPGRDILRAWKLAVLGEVLMERDRLGEARSAVSETALGPYDRDSILYQPFRDALARVELLSGNAGAALEHLEAERAWERQWGVRNTGWTSWRSQAVRANLALGRTEEARALAMDELAAASAFGAPRASGVALRTAARVEAEGVSRLSEAVEVLAGSEARLAHAWALYELGSARRRGGHPVEARTPLHAALDMAARCGADALQRHCREELRSAGARPRRERLTGIEALTPQQRRVAQMAAQGLTNREVAQALFLTTRTIEMHLAAAYEKLGVAGRTDLPAELRADVARDQAAEASV